MATDYKGIAKENERRYGEETEHLRIYKRLYSDKTHFVSELIQNADDSKSQHLELQLNSNSLFVWNDGRQFTEQDVRNICSLGLSDKDLTQIGTFGIGFKAVYNYTDSPEIYSGFERFLIRHLIKPEGIDVGDITPTITTHLEKGRTVFQLPFKNSLRQEDIEPLMRKLRDLDKRSLLFLRHLKEIHWRNIDSTQVGSYYCHRIQHDKIQDASTVTLQTSVNGDDQTPEVFLVFRKKVKPPQYVTDELLHHSEDDKEEQRIQTSAEELQPVEVAFKLHDGGITIIDNCVLYAYLPTQIKTDLRFLINARYQTTPARDNIPDYNPWNKWLVQETADFLPEVLEQLKTSGLLTPTFFNVLPLKGEVDNALNHIAKSLHKSMSEKTIIPTGWGDQYEKAENVFYPHRESLRKLVKCDSLYPNSSWLHPEIRDTEEFRRCFTVMREAEVKEIGFNKVLGWLEEQESSWFEDKCLDWLLCLYGYLNSQKSEIERIKKLPLVRLENGKHVSTTDGLVFFPPSTDEAREDIHPFLDELPIVQSTLLEGAERNDIEVFLKNLEVRSLYAGEMIKKWILPQYSQSNKPSVIQNCLHVCYIFKVWESISASERRDLKEKIGETPILLAYNSVDTENLRFVRPSEVYLPKVYTSHDDLETYFSVSDCEIWFVDDLYIENDSNRRDWFDFLIAIGAMKKLRMLERTYEGNLFEIRSKSNIERGNISITGEEIIEDYTLPGLSTVLYKISEYK